MTTKSNTTDVSVSMVTQVNEETKALIDKMPYREMVTRWITITGGEDKFDRNMETTFYFHEVMIHKGAGKTAEEAAKLAWASLLEEYKAAEAEEIEQAGRITEEAQADEEFKQLTAEVMVE